MIATAFIAEGGDISMRRIPRRTLMPALPVFPDFDDLHEIASAQAACLKARYGMPVRERYVLAEITRDGVSCRTLE